MLGILEIRDRHLVRAPGALDRLVVDKFRTGPAFWRAEHDHRPARALHACAAGPRRSLDLAYPDQDLVERSGQGLVHQRRIMALDEIRVMAIAAEQVGQLLPTDAGEDGRVRDLEAVEMQDRQHRPIACRVEELVRVPARRQRPGLGLAVANDAGDDQVGIVEGRAVGMGQGIAELAALVDGARSFRRHMAWNAVRPGELAEQPVHAVAAALDRRITLGVGAFQIGVRHQPGTAMTGTDHVDHVQVMLLDQTIEVDVEKIQSRRRAPMSQQAGFDMVERQRNIEQGIVPQIDLADREVIRGTPVGVHFLQQIGRQWTRRQWIGHQEISWLDERQQPLRREVTPACTPHPWSGSNGPTDALLYHANPPIRSMNVAIPSTPTPARTLANRNGRSPRMRLESRSITSRLAPT